MIGLISAISTEDQSHLNLTTSTLGGMIFMYILKQVYDFLKKKYAPESTTQKPGEGDDDAAKQLGFFAFILAAILLIALVTPFLMLALILSVVSSLTLVAWLAKRGCFAESRLRKQPTKDKILAERFSACKTTLIALLNNAHNALDLILGSFKKWERFSPFISTAVTEMDAKAKTPPLLIAGFLGVCVATSHALCRFVLPLVLIIGLGVLAPTLGRLPRGLPDPILIQTIVGAVGIGGLMYLLRRLAIPIRQEA